MKNIQSHFKFFYGYYCRRIKLNYFPLKVFIEPTNVCNFKCKICPQSTKLKIPKGFMDLRLYESILRQIKGHSPRIVLHLFGEPLLHSEINTMIKKAKECGLETKFHTNGSLLTEELSKKIIDSGLDRIVFSFNGADSKETYEQICEGANFDKVIHNIKNFLNIRQQKKNKSLKIGFELVKVNNYKDLQQIIESFKNLFKDYESLDFDCIPVHSWSSQLSLKLNLKFKNRYHIYAPCQHLWDEFCICWDGTVVGCCLDALRKFILGDVKKQTVEEIWNGEKIQWLRQKLVKQEYRDLDLCRDCERLWANKTETNPLKWIAKKAITWLGQKNAKKAISSK